MRVTPVIILSLTLTGFAAKAQRPAPGSDTVLKGSTIEVNQTYKPRVKQSPKPEWKPQLPPVDTSKPVFNADVPQQTLYYTYNSPPLRPLALGKNTTEAPFANYLKAGMGNKSTIYLDAGIGALRGDDYETAIHLHHLSQKGNIINQHSSLSGLEADGTLHKADFDVHGALTGFHNRYSYYGYDHDLYNYNKDTVSQAYTHIKLAADFSNKKDTNADLIYHPGLSFSYYGAKYNTSEFTIGVETPVTYKVNSNLDLHLGLGGALTSYKADTVTIANNYIYAAPGLKLHIEDFSAHALAGMALGKGGSTYFLPDVEIAYSMYDYLFGLSLGWKSTLRQNTYEQLTTENPYMASYYNVIQTKRDEIFLNVQGAAGNNFSYAARVSYWNFRDLPTFLNDLGDGRQFYILYQDTKALSFRASARYRVARHWSAGLTADYYSFFKSTDQYVWHEPSTRIKADFTITPIPKLDISLYAVILGGIHGRAVSHQNITLKPATDIGLSAEYQIIPRLSAFMQINNLLDNKYQRWLGYQVYGFNIYGGIRLKF